MTERFESDWTREIEKLRADKAALLEALKLALITIESAPKTNMFTRAQIRAAIAQAERK